MSPRRAYRTVLSKGPFVVLAAGLALAMLVMTSGGGRNGPTPHATTGQVIATQFGTTIESATDLATKTSEFGHMGIVRVY